MRIIITESQFNRVLLNETKQTVIPDDKLSKAKSIVSKLTSRGFNVDDASAMAGNMWAESKFDSSAQSPNGAIGLLQWLSDRQKALKSLANHRGLSWSDEKTQLDFIKIELKDGYKLEDGKFIPNLPKDIKSSNKYEVNNFNDVVKTDTIREKAFKFAKLVERCGNCDGTIDVRKESAKKIHDYVVGKYEPKNTVSSEKKQTNGSMVGKTIYPKKGGDGYVNVRVNTNREIKPIVKISYPDIIGKVTMEKNGDDGKKWYKVTLDKKVGDYTSGWVRSDMVE